MQEGHVPDRVVVFLDWQNVYRGVGVVLLAERAA
jgi:hypothetical protein